MSKGSANRVRKLKQFRDNFDEIRWSVKPKVRTINQGELFHLLKENPSLKYRELPYIGDTWWYEIEE